MKKISILAFSILVTAITIYSFLEPSYHLQQLIIAHTGYAIFRMTAALVPAMYFVVPRLRTDFAQKLLRAYGVGLLSYGAITFFSPTFFGSFATYIPFAEVFIAIEGGVLATLLSIELPAGQPALISNHLLTLRSQLMSQPQKLLQTGARSKAKVA